MEPHQFWIHITIQQLKLLVKFMGSNQLVAKGVDCRTTIGKSYHDSKWQQVADLLNEQKRGIRKSPKEWSVYWSYLKNGIRKKVKNIRHTCRNIHSTGIEQILYRHNAINNIIAQDALKFTVPKQETSEEVLQKKVGSQIRKVTPGQIRLIIEFLRRHPNLSKPHKTGFQKHYHDTKWKEIAKKLNAQFKSPKKSSKDWRRYWNELRNEIRWKVLKGVDLNNIEQVVYEAMCENNSTESVNDDTASNYTPPIATDTESEDENNFEVEYLEDAIHEDDPVSPVIPEAEEVVDCPQEVQGIDLEPEDDTRDKPQEDCSIMESTVQDNPVYYSDISDSEVKAILPDYYCQGDLSTNITSIVPEANEAVGYPEEPQFIATEQEVHTTVEPQMYGNIGNTEESNCRHYFSSFLPNNNDTSANEPVSNVYLPNDVISNINSNIMNNSNAEVLLDIRNELKLLIELQQDRAISAQRSATAQERKAYLDEKKLFLEERRLVMEEKKLALQEKRLGENKCSFPKFQIIH